jgi:hypothetical protein
MGLEEARREAAVVIGSDADGMQHTSDLIDNSKGGTLDAAPQHVIVEASGRKRNRSNTVVMPLYLSGIGR